MKYAPRKVFVLENGNYIELTYQQFEERKEKEPEMSSKWFIPVQGCLLETDQEQYADFYREKERQKYLHKLDENVGLLSIDAFDTETDNGNGERPKYYVENNHPAIIDEATFGRVQEELARRAGKPKVKQVGTKIEQGKYSGKYALTEKLVCGECKTPYRRCTWTVKGKKKIVWRCISRLDFGKKYCHESPTIEESVLHQAIMRAILRTAQMNTNVLNTLKLHIGMALTAEQSEDESIAIQIRIAEIDAEFNAMLKIYLPTR